MVFWSIKPFYKCIGAIANCYKTRKFFMWVHHIYFPFVGAEKVLNTLIKNEENLGHWIYESSADYLLVSSVCIQIKGDILRGLGLWVEAAKALIKSIVGFRTLPKEDIKGWGSSLSLLADAFQYMALEDFKKDIAPYYKLISPHPVLEAIQCVNEAANLSIYSPLFYTKNKVSFLLDCFHFAVLSKPPFDYFPAILSTTYQILIVHFISMFSYCSRPEETRETLFH